MHDTVTMHVWRPQDNLALDALAAAQLRGSGSETPTVAQMNGLVAGAMAATTAPLRFPGAPLSLVYSVCSHCSRYKEVRIYVFIDIPIYRLRRPLL